MNSYLEFLFSEKGPIGGTAWPWICLVIVSSVGIWRIATLEPNRMRLMLKLVLSAVVTLILCFLGAAIVLNIGTLFGSSVLNPKIGLPMTFFLTLICYPLAIIGSIEKMDKQNQTKWVTLMAFQLCQTYHRFLRQVDIFTRKDAISGLKSSHWAS